MRNGERKAVVVVRWGSVDPPAGEGPKGGRKRCFSAGNGALSPGVTPPVVPGPPGRPRRWPRPPPSKESMAQSAADPLHPGGKGAAAAVPARRVRNGEPSRPRDAGGSAPRENRGPQVSLGSPPLSLPFLREPGETQGEADHRVSRRECASAGHGRGAESRYLRSLEASQGLPLARLPPPPLKFSPEPIANFSQPEYMEQLRLELSREEMLVPAAGQAAIRKQTVVTGHTPPRRAGVAWKSSPGSLQID